MTEQALKPTSKQSGGHIQRVAIANALINYPDIIMGVEITVNLKSKNTAIIFVVFKEISYEFSQTNIVVTHDLDYTKGSECTIELADGKVIRM